MHASERLCRRCQRGLEGSQELRGSAPDDRKRDVSAGVAIEKTWIIEGGKRKETSSNKLSVTVTDVMLEKYLLADISYCFHYTLKFAGQAWCAWIAARWPRLVIWLFGVVPHARYGWGPGGRCSLMCRAPTRPGRRVPDGAVLWCSAFRLVIWLFGLSLRPGGVGPSGRCCTVRRGRARLGRRRRWRLDTSRCASTPSL
jgi:hypothetical protein